MLAAIFHINQNVVKIYYNKSSKFFNKNPINIAFKTD